ncbi:hypothetical protein QJS10_CPA09g01423 [Acorus calamus]|uniref:SWIRM domain-containing protein n=1 Tax=Acorus calamus TaxID=4465 RepID=A0AAV9E7T9_ACOCL|nr:hypothetical protein QJS10_CPA09g01423 [Acorus calamus]
MDTTTPSSSSSASSTAATLNGAHHQRRSSRRTSQKRKNYDESLMDDLMEEQLGRASKKRTRTREEMQRETEKEALIALSLGFPIDDLLEEEVAAAVISSSGDPSEQNDYIVVRNHILSRWRHNVKTWLSKEDLRETLSRDHDRLISSAYDFLSLNGHINFGISAAIKNRLPPDPNEGSVIVVGSGLAGLAAARQLLAFGFKVAVLEGRGRPGGRVYSKGMSSEDGRVVAAVDLGGSVITGIHANPLGVLARQLSIPLHKIRENCPLYGPDGAPVDPGLDARVDSVFNTLLEKASRAREVLGESARGISLGEVLEKLRMLHAAARTAEERRLLDWHLANLEYANAGCLSELSAAYWDQDDPYEMDGDHCFLVGGNWRLGVEVVTVDGQVFAADMVLCTVSLGVLKKKCIQFVPELPVRKLEAIQRLGFGLLNKVAMLFPRVFWGEDLDTFGHLNEEESRRGEFFLFFGYQSVSGGPVLIALVAGEAAVDFETSDPAVVLHRVLSILRGIYTPRGIEVPDPIQTVCTRWGSDPLCHGSYSHVSVGSSGADYDILAENVEGRLFFAGEATTRKHPATMHGAFLSGLRAASSILSTSRTRANNNNCARKEIRQCEETIERLFKDPDVVVGDFVFVFDCSDEEEMGLVRVAFEEGMEREVCLYGIVSREGAREVERGGDKGGDKVGLLGVLFEKYGLRLMGIGGLGEVGRGLVGRIAGARKKRKKYFCRRHS